MVDGVLLKNSDMKVTYTAGSKDIKNTKLPEGDVSTPLTVTVTVTGKGNYKQSVTATYTITKAESSKDLSKLKVSLLDKNGKKANSRKCTGSPITYTGDYSMKVMMGNTELKETEYEVTYVNNIYKGKAKIIITPKEGSGYVGSKVVSFTITKGTMNWY